MMVYASRHYLRTIHEACKKEGVEKVDVIDLQIQERVLKNLEEGSQDDCMIDGYEYSAFSPYKSLVPPIDEVTEIHIKQCKDCGYFFERVDMIEKENKFTCKDCAKQQPIGSK